MVMAKGVEDTAFFRYTRLIALDRSRRRPHRVRRGPEEFHAAASGGRPTGRPDDHPHTHDTKRSEDIRARLSVLAELRPMGHARPAVAPAGAGTEIQPSATCSGRRWSAPG